MNCVNCGSVLGEGNKFCMKCGTPVGSMPAPGPEAAPQATIAPVEINPTAPVRQQAPAVIPYAPPVMQDGNVVIPVKRKFRLVCPGCGSVIEDIKRDATAGYPCNLCGKTYAYGGQVLIYRCGNGMPSCALLPVDIIIDGLVYGEIKNTEAVRIMLASGTHVIGVRSRPGWPNSPVTSNQFQVVIGPQSYNLAFKASTVYRYMASNGVELRQCNPEEIPNI